VTSSTLGCACDRVRTLRRSELGRPHDASLTQAFESEFESDLKLRKLTREIERKDIFSLDSTIVVIIRRICEKFSQFDSCDRLACDRRPCRLCAESAEEG
jgi:hypothetical protein